MSRAWRRVPPTAARGATAQPGSAPQAPATPGMPPAGCPTSRIREQLWAAGLRPTSQRLSLGLLLFSHGNRHVTADALYAEAVRTRLRLSRATVYNTLHGFAEAGLLRRLVLDGSRTIFDTNTGEHHHFLVEGTHELLDVPRSAITLGLMPPPPAGMEVAGVEVVVRLRPKRAR